MKDIILMVGTFQRIVSRYYEKEMLFFDFDTGEWYSRWHNETLTTEQVCDWILSITQIEEINPRKYEIDWEGSMRSNQVYMVIIKNKQTNKEHFYISGKGAGTPFASSHLSSAKAQVTKLNNNFQEARVVRIKEWEDVL